MKIVTTHELVNSLSFSNLSLSLVASKGDTMSPRRLSRYGGHNFTFLYDTDGGKRCACLCLHEAVSFLAQMEPREVHEMEILQQLLPWQRKLVHNARVWKHLTKGEKEAVGYSANMATLDEGGQWVSPVPSESFNDDLDNDANGDTNSKFKDGVWTNHDYYAMNFMSPFNSIQVNENRFVNVFAVERLAATSEDLLFNKAQVREIQGRAFKDQDIYWPLSSEVMLVKQVVTEAVSAFVSNQQSGGGGQMGKLHYFDKVKHIITLDRFEILFLNQCQHINQVQVSLSTEILSLNSR
jgi:hypothetical protein